MQQLIKIRNFASTISLLVLALIAADMLESSITGNVVLEEKVIIFPSVGDFPNHVRSVVFLGFNYSQESFADADTLLFLDSDVVPGVKVEYDIATKKIYAGRPIISFEADILDGKPHILGYHFCSIAQRQSIFLDNELVAESEYGPIKNLATGFTVLEQTNFVESHLPIEVQFY